MRIQISQQTVYRYEQPVSGVIQLLRLTPRNHDGQYVVDWRIDVSESCEMQQHDDAFGNVTHVLSADGAISELRILVDGEVETQDTNGVVTGEVERFPPRLFLRETALTQADPAIADFARLAAETAKDDVLGTLHALLDRLHGGLVYDAETSGAVATAAEAFARKRGAGQDFAHVFIAAARSLAIPARYIAGHCANADGLQRAGHAWAEAFVTDLGWVAFDPAQGACPTDAHVRVAVGLDCLGAAPVRGSRFGGGDDVPDVSARISHNASQSQS